MGVRRRAKHAAPPAGPERRGIIASFATGILGVGGVMCVTGATVVRLLGAILVIAAILMFASLWWGWPVRALHARSDRTPERRSMLRGYLGAAAKRLDYLATVDAAPPSIPWLHQQYADRSIAIQQLIDASLGPHVAAEFGAAGWPPRPGIEGIQESIAARVAHLRDLLALLDSLPLMEDWQP